MGSKSGSFQCGHLDGQEWRRTQQARPGLLDLDDLTGWADEAPGPVGGR